MVLQLYFQSLRTFSCVLRETINLLLLTFCREGISGLEFDMKVGLWCLLTLCLDTNMEGLFFVMYMFCCFQFCFAVLYSSTWSSMLLFMGKLGLVFGVGCETISKAKSQILFFACFVKFLVLNYWFHECYNCPSKSGTEYVPYLIKYPGFHTSHFKFQMPIHDI